MSDCQQCPREHECGYECKPCDCVHQRKFTPKTIQQAISAVSNSSTLKGEEVTEGAKLFKIAVDKAESQDQNIVSFILNTTTLEADLNPSKYNYVADSMMSTIFNSIKFDNNIEIQLFVDAISAAARSYGSAAMIRMKDK